MEQLLQLINDINSERLYIVEYVHALKGKTNLAINCFDAEEAYDLYDEAVRELAEFDTAKFKDGIILNNPERNQYDLVALIRVDEETLNEEYIRRFPDYRAGN